MSKSRTAQSERKFVAAVEAIYTAAPDPSQWPQALQAIADVFDDVGTVMMWQRDDGGFGAIVSPSLATAHKDYQRREWNRRDLPSQRLVEKALWLRCDAGTDRDAVTDEDMRTHPFYTDFCERHGLRWRAWVSVAPDPHVAVWMAIQRGPHKKPHSRMELDLVTQLGHHAEKSLRLSIRLLDAELSNHGLRDALSRLGIGVFALDSLGRVVFSNPVGQRLLGDGLTVAHERLQVASCSHCGELESAIGGALSGEALDLISAPKPILIERSRGGRPLTVYVLPIRRSANPSQEFLTHARAIVLAIDPAADDPPDPAVVRDILGLTLGEARVAALVGSGLPPREAAERLGITEESTRTTLKRIFAKVGVSRQSELAALLTKLVLR